MDGQTENRTPILHPLLTTSRCDKKDYNIPIFLQKVRVEVGVKILLPYSALSRVLKGIIPTILDMPEKTK